MDGRKLLLIGVLVGFGGGMAAAIGMKLARGGFGRGAQVARSGTPIGDSTTVAPRVLEASSPSEGGAPTPYDLAASSPAAAGEDEGSNGADEAPTDEDEGSARVDEGTRRVEKTSRSRSSRVAAVPKRTPRARKDAIDELPVEGPPAKLVFGKAAGEGTAITRITEMRSADTSTVRVELTGKAFYKILELPSRHEVWIDFEDVQLPGGEKSASGSNVHIEELRARTFDEGAIARVTLKLANEGKFSVSVSDGFAQTPSARGTGRTGEASGQLDIILSGFVPMEFTGP